MLRNDGDVVTIGSDSRNPDRFAYDYLFSVEKASRLVLPVVYFRHAYKQVGQEIETVNFKPDKTVNHTHQGSIGNLFNDEICRYKDEVVSLFTFEKVHQAEESLLK